MVIWKINIYQHPSFCSCFLDCELKSARFSNYTLPNENSSKKKSQVDIKNEPHHVSSKPDGGCVAWTVVAASFMISLIQEGTIYSFGILVPRISDRFGVGRAEASLASSIFIFLTFASGPAVAALIIRWLTS